MLRLNIVEGFLGPLVGDVPGMFERGFLRYCQCSANALMIPGKLFFILNVSLSSWFHLGTFEGGSRAGATFVCVRFSVSLSRPDP